jgi:4-methyl-5(b-hydroxyethyl)-thiazole monophosphate biosynthesis
MAEGFEDIEALGTTALLRRAGIEVDFISVFNQPTVKGSFKTEVIPDFLMKDFDFKRYDGLFIPGGRAAFTLRETPSVIKLVRNFHENDKYLLAICAAPIVLAASNVMKNIQYISFPGTETDIKEGIRVNQPAVSDGKIITAIGAGAIYEFAFEIVKTTLGEIKAKELAKRILYREFEQGT